MQSSVKIEGWTDGRDHWLDDRILAHSVAAIGASQHLVIHEFS